MMWILNLSDGCHDIFTVAEQSKLPISLLSSVAEELVAAGLVVEKP